LHLLGQVAVAVGLVQWVATQLQIQEEPEETDASLQNIPQWADRPPVGMQAAVAAL
jgi:hypothetical protein